MKKNEKSTLCGMLSMVAAAGLGVALIIQAMPLAFAGNPAALSGFGLTQGALMSCCIAGKYKGTRQDTASRTCLEPTTEDFSMEILQGKKCDADIWGTIVGASDSSPIQYFKGTVTRSAIRGCCDIKGKFSEPGWETEFKGTLCRKGNKWSGTGTYKTTREGAVCSGTFTMSQI
jgi:hypothetical protein